MNRGRLPLLAGAALIGACVSILYLGAAAFQIFELPRLKLQDVLFKARHLFVPKPGFLKDVVLITIDDESIDKIQDRWPFRRKVYADLIDKVDAANPRVIALDFIFAGKGEPLDDFLLSETIQKSGRVVLSAFVDAEGNHVLSLKEIREPALSSGVVNKLVDRDFYVRRTNLYYRDMSGKVAAWPWEIEIFRFLEQVKPEDYEMAPDGVRFYREGEGGRKSFLIPYHGKKEAVINYRVGFEDVNHISLWQVMQSNDLKKIMEGKIVLIGATSHVLHDYYHTPLEMMPGVVINLNWLANIVEKDFLRSVPAAVNLVMVFIMTFAATWVGLKFDILKGLGILLAVTTVFLFAEFGLLIKNLSADAFFPLFAGWGTFLTTAFYRYFHTLIENVRLRGEVVTDPLTGLYNRRYLESRMDQELSKLGSDKKDRKTDAFHELCVMMIDIDNFKKINDTYGHQFGDDVIKNVSFSIKDSTRKDDIVARFGGEEFCVVLLHTAKEQGIQIAEKIRKSVEAKKLSYVNQITSFTISLGVAAARADDLLSSRALVRAADQALYEAKKTGKNKVCTYSPNSVNPL